jgi:ribonuclease E
VARIEDRAYRANLAAAAAAPRQLRLRDIGGLVVIDFIDMRSASSIRAVEKRLREAMRQDKARHDMTRISKLGLLEMSRQRLRSTTASSSYETCPECEGTAVIKTVESAAVALLRRVHTRAARGDLARIRLLLPTGIATYLLNRKREDILRLEQRYETEIVITGRSDLRANDLQFEVEGREAVKREERQTQIEQEPQVKHPEMLEEDGDKPRRRPRRRRRGEERREGEAAESQAGTAVKETADEAPAADGTAAKKPVRRRRRRTTERRESEASEETATADGATAKKPVRRRRRRTAERNEDDSAEASSGTPGSEASGDTPAADGATAKKPVRRRRRRMAERQESEAAEASSGTAGSEATEEAPATDGASAKKPSRRRRGGRSRRSRSAGRQKEESGDGQEDGRLMSGPPDVVSGPDDEWSEDLPSRNLRADGGPSESSR